MATLAQLTTDSTQMIDDMLTSWNGAIGTNGCWNNVDPLPDYWANAAAPAAACAIYDHVTGGTKYLARAIAAIDGALTDYQIYPDGSFGPSATDNAIDTMEFGKVLATTMLLYGDLIPASTRRRWLDKMRGGAEYLHTRGVLAYYTNGNIVIGDFAFLRLAHILCGDPWIAHYAEKSWWTLHAPVESIDVSWAGYGLIIDTKPVAPYDASAGETGYFTEEGGGGNGLDWDYSQYQLDELAFYYVLTRDPAIPRLMNFILNKIWPRVDTTNWTLNTMGGSRQGYAAPTTPRLIGLCNSSLGVARLLMGRTDLPDITSATGQFYSTSTNPCGSISHVFGAGGVARAGGSEELAPGWHRNLYGALGTLTLALVSLRRPTWPLPLHLTSSIPERRRWLV